MATPNPVLSEMINNAPEQVAAADQNLDQINETQSKLGEESIAIEENICDVAADDLKIYLDGTKLVEIQLLYPAVPGVWGDVYIVYGATYGTIAWSPLGNITDWEFRQDDLTMVPPPPGYVVRYVYTPLDDPDIDEWVDDFVFGNDYITRPLDTGAAYGLNPLIAAYESAKVIVQEGKDKVEASIDILTRYL